MRILRIIAGVVLGLSSLGVTYDGLDFGGARPRPSARETLLTRQNQELVKLASAADHGTLLDFKSVLIVVKESLVQDLLHAVTPVEADIGEGFHVRIESADAAFADGVALVRLAGSARVGGATVGSPVTVLGAIDVVEMDPSSGLLKCRASLLGVEAQDAGALGRGDAVGRLTEALAHGGLALLLGPFEIPVSLQNRLAIPAVDSRRLKIAAATLPLTITVKEVKVFGGRLWVFVDAAVAPAPAKPEAKS